MSNFLNSLVPPVVAAFPTLPKLGTVVTLQSDNNAYRYGASGWELVLTNINFSGSFVPYYVGPNTNFTIPTGYQAHTKTLLTVQGLLGVNGFLIGN